MPVGVLTTVTYISMYRSSTQSGLFITQARYLTPRQCCSFSVGKLRISSPPYPLC